MNNTQLKDCYTNLHEFQRKHKFYSKLKPYLESDTRNTAVLSIPNETVYPIFKLDIPREEAIMLHSINLWINSDTELCIKVPASIKEDVIVYTKSKNSLYTDSLSKHEQELIDSLVQ